MLKIVPIILIIGIIPLRYKANMASKRYTIITITIFKYLILLGKFKDKYWGNFSYRYCLITKWIG